MFRGLTKIGQSYLAKKISKQEPVEFLKVDIGNGSITSGDPEQTTDLKSFKMSAKFKEKKQIENAVTLTIQISNENVEEGFYLKEIGIYVKGEGDEPILYWYCNEDNAQYINDKSESALAFEIDIKMQVSNATSNILNWSGEDTWVDVEYLNKQLAKKEDAFEKNTAFNKNFGITTGTILEGNKYPIIEGIAGDKINPGFIQDSGEKTQNKFYLDKNTGRLYRCLKTTQSTTNSSEFFKDVSLANISDRLDNLTTCMGSRIYTSIPLKSANYNFHKLENNTDYVIEVADGYLSIPAELKWCPYEEAQWRALYINLQSKKMFGIVITRNKITIYGVDSVPYADFSIYKKNIK